MDDKIPTGVRRLLLRSRAYLRIGVWMLQEINPWRRRYGKQK